MNIKSMHIQLQKLKTSFQSIIEIGFTRKFILDIDECESDACGENA